MYEEIKAFLGLLMFIGGVVMTLMGTLSLRIPSRKEGNNPVQTYLSWAATLLLGPMAAFMGYWMFTTYLPRAFITRSSSVQSPMTWQAYRQDFIEAVGPISLGLVGLVLVGIAITKLAKIRHDPLKQGGNVAIAYFMVGLAMMVTIGLIFN